MNQVDHRHIGEPELENTTTSKKKPPQKGAYLEGQEDLVIMVKKMEATTLYRV